MLLASITVPTCLHCSSLGLFHQLHGVEAMCAELMQLHAGIKELTSTRQKLTSQVQGMTQDLARATVDRVWNEIAAPDGDLFHHFSSLLESAIFPAIVMNEKDIMEWEEDSDEYIRKNLPSELYSDGQQHVNEEEVVGEASEDSVLQKLQKVKLMEERNMKPLDLNLAALSARCSKDLELNLAKSLLSEMGQCTTAYPYN
ncbi:unnamed protein product [Lactuca saligna]|uniref:Uncharacterized protein n=1 Tax=Lactuca saligna TaxID=75948 RepID=A0AA35VI30_LACSI|nr:unnamed protein product [Lactuca saligna]